MLTNEGLLHPFRPVTAAMRTPVPTILSTIFPRTVCYTTSTMEVTGRVLDPSLGRAAVSTCWYGHGKGLRPSGWVALIAFNVVWVKIYGGYGGNRSKLPR